MQVKETQQSKAHIWFSLCLCGHSRMHHYMGTVCNIRECDCVAYKYQVCRRAKKMRRWQETDVVAVLMDGTHEMERYNIKGWVTIAIGWYV